MKILLIACSYPPDPFVGSFRAAKLARAFVEAGHEVDVITCRLAGETSAVRADEPGLRVHTVREVPGPKALYRALARRFRGSAAGGAGGAAGGNGGPPSSNRNRHVPTWKRYLLSMIWVPDDRQGFIPAALRRSVPLVRRGVDLVYTTAPPFSDHLVGLALKLTTRARWVAEFRDPWVENENKPAYVRSRAMDALNRSLERRCVRNADQLVAVSEGTADLLRRKLPADRRDRVLLALNGIDNLVPPHAAEPRDAGPLKIMHLGNCYGGRDPRLFLRALAAVVRRQRLTPADVRLEFVGKCRSYQGESLERMVEDLGIAALVRFSDWVAQEEARRRAREADLFLLPFPRQRGIIPNKLFDYLGFRKPILAFVHPDGEPARMLERLGGHYLITDERQESAEAAIEAALRDGRRAPGYGVEGEALLAAWTTEEQLRGLLDQLQVPAGAAT